MPLAHWYLCKALDAAPERSNRRGRGRIRSDVFYRWLRSRQLFFWSGRPLSERRFRKHIRQGEGIFWHVGPGRTNPGDAPSGCWLYLHSWDRVCETLDVVPCAVLEMPLEAFRTLHSFRSYCYGGLLAYEHTVSRAHLTAATGMTKETMNQYDKVVHTQKQANLGLAQYSTHADAKRLLEWLNEDDGSGPKRKRGYMHRDGLTVGVYMPSTLYVDGFRPLSNGRAKRIRERMLQADSSLQSSDSSYHSSASAHRRYCDTGQQARRSEKRGTLAPEYFVKTGKKLGKSRVWLYGHAYQNTGAETYALAA